ncbi:MAG: HNH endonuclease [Polynucleobacter sp.]
MPVRAKRVCRSTGCGNATDSADGYCQTCTAAGRNDSGEQRRTKQTEPFYVSPEWRRYRKWWLMHHPLCVSCGRPGQMVDHITAIRDGGAKLSQGNTQTLCHRCHGKKTGGDRREANRMTR